MKRRQVLGLTLLSIGGLSGVSFLQRANTSSQGTLLDVTTQSWSDVGFSIRCLIKNQPALLQVIQNPDVPLYRSGQVLIGNYFVNHDELSRFQSEMQTSINPHP